MVDYEINPSYGEKWTDIMSLDDIKANIQANINAASSSFSSIGYYLKYIRDEKLYTKDGYTTIWEFAQNEFGIGKSNASRFMSINDKFSINGNSSDLKEQYSNFSSSKLSEMLTLTDEQMIQVVPTTTIAEIRQIKKPDTKAVLTSEQELEIYGTDNQTIYIREMFNTPEFLDIKKIISEMIIRRLGAGNAHYEVQDYLEVTLPRESSGFKFTAGDRNGLKIKRGLNFIVIPYFPFTQIFQNLFVDSKDIAEKMAESFKSEKEDHNIDNFKTNVFEEADKQINIPEVDKRILYDIAKWCIKKLKDNLQLGIDTHGFNSSMEPLLFMNLQSNAIRVIHNYSIEFGKIYVKITDHEYDKTENLLYMDIDQEIHRIWFEETEEPEDDCPEELIDEVEDIETEDGKLENEPVEIVHSDIIQTKAELDDQINALSLAKELLSKRNASLSDALRVMGEKERTTQDNKYIEKLKIEVAALDEYIYDLSNNDIPKLIQPELIILKNNDQRKDFIEAYASWPIWIDTELTGERYYRYDFDNNTSFVIRVSLHYAWERGKYSKIATYGCEEYYMIGVPDKYKPDGKTFHECSTNKSAMIDYLKEIQKK